MAIKNFLLSPTTITLLKNGQNSLIFCSIKTGATFSPPAVIINSFNLPVMSTFPFLSKRPKLYKLIYFKIYNIYFYIFSITF